MLDNKRYFEYSKEHPEPLFDPFYAKNMQVIPSCAGEQNKLIERNKRLIDLITAFQVVVSMGKGMGDEELVAIVNEVRRILDTTKNINFSPFCQFFMVQNSSYTTYKELADEEKPEFLYEMLIRYCQERHDMYKGYGYSDISLQVVCDSYSHKRNSKTSIDKFVNLLAPYSLHELCDVEQVLSDDDYYFLPDKTGRKYFVRLLSELGLKMESRAIEQGKMPDVVFKHRGQYYIFELKMMKGSGGGQNKQAVESAYFIKFAESDEHIHYGVLLDGLYANTLFESKQPKIAHQRSDVVEALEANPGNFFVNTAGAELLLSDIFSV